MHLKKLSIKNLRNIEDEEIYPGNLINLIIGPNGAGKTTLLESIYLLARAKSFRQGQNRNLISNKQNELIIFTELENDDRTSHKVGLKKTKEKTTVRKNNFQINKLSELATTIPLTIITPNIQRIIEEGPSYRRKLLNWGMFHVEHKYAELIQRYRKTLFQRNRALLEKREELAIWTKQLASLGEALYQLQTDYIAKWNESLSMMVRQLSNAQNYKLDLVNGWRRGITLEQALVEQTKSDSDRGFTSVGPHRLDLKISVDGKNVKNYFSRGQSKLLALLMLLSQTTMLKDNNRESPIILIDDIQSELDIENYRKICKIIEDLNYQTFITALDQEASTLFRAEALQMFHVEHGRVKRI